MFTNFTHNENLNHLAPYSQLKKEKYNYDRFIPSRKHMEEQRSREAYHCSPVLNQYHLNIYQILFNGRHPNQPILSLSERTFRNEDKYSSTEKVKPLSWEFLSFKKFEGTFRSINKPCVWSGADLVTHATRNCIYITELKSDKITPLPLGRDVVEAFSWDASNHHLAVVYNSDNLCLWDPNAQRAFPVRKGTGEVQTSQVEWKNSDLIAMGYNEEFEVVDRRTAKCAIKYFSFEDDIYSSFQFAQKEHHIHFTTEKGLLQTVDLRKDTGPISSKKIANKRITHFERLDQTTEKVITTSLDGFIRIFDIKNDKYKLIKEIETKRPLLSLTRFGKQAAVTVHTDGYASFWDSDYAKTEVVKIPGLRFLAANPSKNQLSMMIDQDTEQTLSFYKFIPPI